MRAAVLATIDNFQLLPEEEQVRLRKKFGEVTNPITAKAWNKDIVGDPAPEKFPRFRYEFYEFLQKESENPDE